MKGTADSARPVAGLLDLSGEGGNGGTELSRFDKALCILLGGRGGAG